MFFMSSSVIPVKKWQKMIFSLRWRYSFVDSPFGDIIQSTVCLTVQQLFCWLPNTWLEQSVLISFFSWWFLFAVVRIQKRQFATIIWERFNGTNDTCLMFSFVRLSHSVYSWECLHNEILSVLLLNSILSSMNKCIFDCSYSCTLFPINVSMSCRLLCLFGTIWPLDLASWTQSLLFYLFAWKQLHLQTQWNGHKIKNYFWWLVLNGKMNPLNLHNDQTEQRCIWMASKWITIILSVWI